MESAFLNQWLSHNDEITYGRQKNYLDIPIYRLRHNAIKQMLENQIIRCGNISRNQLESMGIDELFHRFNELYNTNLSYDDAIALIYANNHENNPHAEKLIPKIKIYKQNVKKLRKNEVLRNENTLSIPDVDIINDIENKIIKLVINPHKTGQTDAVSRITSKIDTWKL